MRTGLANTPQYNGNISGQTWRDTYKNERAAYRYGYDALSRLTSSTYGVLSGTTLTQTNRYNENLTYDLNGNIKTLGRWGLSGTTALQIDNLTYGYRGNRLFNVRDISSTTLGFQETSTSTTAQEYTFDAMGNLVSDINPTTDVYLSYNHLNRITERRTTAGGAVQATYTWAADGTKLKAQNHTSGFTTDYIGPYQYENGNLAFFFTAEGRCIQSGSLFVYEYSVKDHLGNTRATFDVPSGTTARLVQSTHYYPFGLEINSLAYNLSPGAPNDYKYNGKELQTDFGLGWYDYGARMYDATLGRWHSVDPLAEAYEILSPYAYVANSPISSYDPDGQRIKEVDGGYKFTGKHARILAEILISNGGDLPEKVFPVYKQETPAIYQHTLRAFLKGKPQVLTYDSDPNASKLRRNAALAGVPKAPTGQQRDEYPYATTNEGGAGASVEYVPNAENSTQGAQLGLFYRTLSDGEQFLVLPISGKRPPKGVPVPVPVPARRGVIVKETAKTVPRFFRALDRVLFRVFPFLFLPCWECEFQNVKGLDTNNSGTNP